MLVREDKGWRGGVRRCMHVAASLLEFAASHHWKGEGQCIVQENPVGLDTEPHPRLIVATHPDKGHRPVRRVE